jgi:tRNA (guanosine-2'-O-)-methyltransferase
MTDAEPLGTDLDRITVEGATWPAAAALEALRPHLLPARLERYDAVLRDRLASLAVGVEDLHHSYNGAACLRTCEGMGLADVVAVESTKDFPHPETAPGAPSMVPRKVSKTAHRWLDLHKAAGAAELRAWADAREMAIWGTSPVAEHTVDAVPVEGPLLILFGNELNGLRESTAAVCDGTFRLPMWGFVESFNISVAVGMSLAVLVPRVRARLAAADRTGDLPAHRADWLRARWAARDVRGAAAILRRKLGAGVAAPSLDAT